MISEKRKSFKHSVEFPIVCASAKSVGVIIEIAAERRRQVEVEGWTDDHDDDHDAGELAAAAACYVASAAAELDPICGTPIEDIGASAIGWPWDRAWYKLTNPRRDLIKAAALIAAEIERIDRTASADVSRETCAADRLSDAEIDRIYHDKRPRIPLRMLSQDELDQIDSEIRCPNCKADISGQKPINERVEDIDDRCNACDAPIVWSRQAAPWSVWTRDPRPFRDG